MNEVYLCLGGNLGNTVAIFARVIEILRQKGELIKCKSSIYKSEAWGMENAPDFFNQVIAIETSLSPDVLMKELLLTEHESGRERSYNGTYESRKIDIDILMYGDRVVNEEHLHIPHPRMHLRRFVLEPLAEIAPQLQHPVLHKTISQLLIECPDKGRIERISHVA